MGKWDVNWGEVETVPYQYGVYYYANSPTKGFVGRGRAEREREQAEYNRRSGEKYEETAAQVPGYGVMTPEAREAASSKTPAGQKASSKTNPTQGRAQSTTTKKSSGSKRSSATQQPTTPQPDIIGGYNYTPTTSGTQVSRGGWSFEVPTQPQISQEDWDTYINQPIVDNNTNTTNYDTNYIRGFRGQGEQGYRDVDSYLTWLKNNKDSADYKLFMQNGYFKDSGDALDRNELDYDQIRAMLASQGIRGNLGRRDSRRLGNVLTRLRNQSTAGTPENAQFLQGVVSSYNQNKDKFRPAEGYTGLRNAIITGDGQIGFLDESGNETYFPYSKQSPTYQIDENSPEFQAIRNQFSTTNPSSGFQPVSQGNWLGSAGNILGSTYRPQWNMGPRTAFFGTSISNQAKNMMKAWNDFIRGLLPLHKGFNSGANG